MQPKNTAVSLTPEQFEQFLCDIGSDPKKASFTLNIRLRRTSANTFEAKVNFHAYDPSGKFGASRVKTEMTLDEIAERLIPVEMALKSKKPRPAKG